MNAPALKSFLRIIVPLAVITSALVIPIHHASAILEEALLTVFGLVPSIIIGVVNSLLSTIFRHTAESHVPIALWTLSWTVTPGGAFTPPVIDQAWEYMRNLANIFFLLILAFIGLSTILQLDSGYQKTLKNLIIAAVLVNFSGVFVGIMVDATNIIARAFLQQAAVITTPHDFGDGGISIITQLSLSIFYIIGILTYIVALIIFGFRVVALWLLTIFSPLAIAAYVLPQTNKIFKTWLSTLMQWTVLIIPLSFFLYLSSQLLNIASEKIPESMGGVESNFFYTLTAILPIATLLIGIGVTGQMGPAQAKQFTGFLEGKAKALAAAPGKRFAATAGNLKDSAFGALGSGIGALTKGNQSGFKKGYRDLNKKTGGALGKGISAGKALGSMFTGAYLAPSIIKKASGGGGRKEAAKEAKEAADEAAKEAADEAAEAAAASGTQTTGGATSTPQPGSTAQTKKPWWSPSSRRKQKGTPDQSDKTGTTQNMGDEP